MKWTAETMRDYLDAHKTDGRIMLRALRVIYDRQTRDEQASRKTICRNGMGFTGWDAPLLTDIAERATLVGYLTARQTALVHKLIRKYAGQLADAAHVKGSPAPPAPLVQAPLFTTPPASNDGRGCQS